MKIGRRAKNRRGIAGIVAIVIIFAIMFSVGTSYYIYVNSQNAAYATSLFDAANAVQARQTESLAVTTLLEADGDVGFFANDTSSLTVNMTAVLVLSSTGALLKCDGVGFPAGSGCSNSTPALWETIDAGKGSSTIDTGYVYAAGTTDTLKVLTARGNTYNQTYPEPASDTGSTQAVTVNLDNLKWVQLIPEASSLVQKNYVANCNSASCAATYSSSVTAGNILVDAVGWASNAPPSGVPTDTRGDVFNLGVSSSVGVSASPAVVQEKYTSNCNAASCGLAFTSSVTAGHELVYAVGWANHAAPSAPTDTRGDTFTLGASESQTVTPPTPALVQHRFLADCSSATCSLAYSSSVTAGNTLVLGLGWPTTQQYSYVPITITNSQSSATPNPFQQMVTWDPASYSSYEAANLGNVRFCADSQCASPLYAWLESCSSTCSTGGSTSSSATAWVRLTSSVGASGGQLTIYMVFEATSVNFDDNYWGEAPQLSSTYAQYDNGANVFTAYFNGNTATSSFSVYTGYTLAQATGVSGPGGTTIHALEATGYNGANPVFSFNTALSNAGLIAEASFSSPGCTENSPYTGTDTGAVGLVNNVAASSVNDAVSGNCGYGGVYFDQDYNSGGTYTEDANAAGTASPSWLYATLTYTGSGASSWSAYIAPQLYSATGGDSGTVTSNPLSAATHLYLGQISYTSNGYSITIYYNFMRARAYPPSGVMPSTSLGSLSSGGGVPSISDTLGDTFTVGASQSATAAAGTPALVQKNYASNCNSSSCGVAFSSSVTQGNMLVFALGWHGVSPPSTPTDTLGDAFTLGVSNSVTVSSTTYYSYVWYGTALSSGTDTITASFGSTVTGSVSIYALSGVTASGLLTSTGSSSGGSNTATVSSFTPTSNSFVIGNTETNSGSTTFSNGGGYTLVGTCSTVSGCSEYETGSSGSTTVSTNLGTSPSWVESAISFGPGTPTYFSYLWYATAASSGSDTITATFSSAVSGSVSIYEITGYSTSGVLSSTGSSSAGSTAASVTSFTPSSNSFAVGNVETGAASTGYTVGSGYTTVASGSGGCDASDASQGCSEYELGLGSATTTPFALSPSMPWADVAMSFGPLPTNTYYSYIYYATAASSGADTISASFGSTVAGSVSIYEISGVTATGLLTSTGGSTASQATVSVTSITPNTGSVVIGNAETTSAVYTAGTGYTLSGTCSSVLGCGEYQTGVGTATTVSMSISPSAPWVEAAVAFAPTVTNYYSYIWYATAGTSGSDTITTTFGSTVAGSVSIYEINGYTTSNFLTSTGSSSTSSTGAAVAAYTPDTDSFIVGMAEGAASSNAFTAGTGFTLGGTCSTVEGCSEYDSSNTDGGSANTVPITLGTSTPWVEASMAFSTPFNPQSGIQVGGYPTMGVPASAVLVWEATFTNVDSQHRVLTLWPQSEIAIGSKESNTYDLGYIQAHYYIIDGLNPGSTTVNAYTSTTGKFLTLAYNVPTTIYFAATAALGSTTQPFGNNYGTPFEAYFALTGIFSDGTLMGETIPYPYGIITESNAYTTPTAGSTGATVTVTCTAPCDFDASSTAIVGWINAEGQMTTLATFTTTASGNIPSGVTFSVPTATAGYYTIEVTDYVNAVFMTFQHT